MSCIVTLFGIGPQSRRRPERPGCTLALTPEISSGPIGTEIGHPTQVDLLLHKADQGLCSLALGTQCGSSPNRSRLQLDAGRIGPSKSACGKRCSVAG